MARRNAAILVPEIYGLELIEAGAILFNSTNSSFPVIGARIPDECARSEGKTVLATVAQSKTSRFSTSVAFSAETCVTAGTSCMGLPVAPMPPAVKAAMLNLKSRNALLAIVAEHIGELEDIRDTQARRRACFRSASGSFAEVWEKHQQGKSAMTMNESVIPARSGGCRAPSGASIIANCLRNDCVGQVRLQITMMSHRGVNNLCMGNRQLSLGSLN
ncbi:hypothetical protein B0H13DRAFT_1866812 [Mycena leptocephala]|nr:hypothetical protein B0H13DRAFT_1866812 [Mycena leptocephala]